ncbi:hypothetical protein [Thalassobellus suaedae]|uniref:ATP synthase F0 subunit 8 n=1 Tax=Thalassobellus suaedae TaxID=3074124 RepID=A0ABY9XW20_9FLAO|nr:hypothetical protein RHP51_04970 [Flavobacteriaceae bacterium HL-DH14]
MEKWKITLSVIVGSIFMIIPLYQVIMYGLLLSEKINYTFISFCFGIALIAFWGRLKVLAKNIQGKYTNTK